MPALKFSDKLVLNQWIISLFGINTFAEHRDVRSAPSHQAALVFSGVIVAPRRAAAVVPHH